MTKESDSNSQSLIRWGIASVVALGLLGLGLFAYQTANADTSAVVVSDDPPSSTAETPTSTTVTTTTASSQDQSAKTDPEEKPGTPEVVDEKAGLEEIVDDFLAGMWAFDGPREIHVSIYESKLASDDPAIKLRGEFELNVLVELGKHSDAEDPYYFPLYAVLLDSHMRCGLEAMGLELEDLEPEDLAEQVTNAFEQYEALIDELGWDEQTENAVSDRCWQEALQFPSLGEGEGQRRLDLQRKYYLDIAREWAAANPDLVVPLPG